MFSFFFKYLLKPLYFHLEIYANQHDRYELYKESTFDLKLTTLNISGFLSVVSKLRSIDAGTVKIIK